MRADKVLTGKTGENGQYSRRRARAPWTRPSVRRFALGVYERACRDGSLSTGSPVGHSTIKELLVAWLNVQSGHHKLSEG